QTRHRTKPASDARRLAVHERRQRLGEHARIELVGFTIHIQKSPWEMRLEQGRPEPHRRSKQVIDVTVFRMANAQGIQTRRFDEGMRVIPPAMRGVKDERNALFRRRAYLEVRYQTKIALQTHSSPVLDRNSQAIRQRSTLITQQITSDSPCAQMAGRRIFRTLPGVHTRQSCHTEQLVAKYAP